MSFIVIYSYTCMLTNNEDNQPKYQFYLIISKLKKLISDPEQDVDKPF